jgi:Serine dehydrogenase proteinase
MSGTEDLSLIPIPSTYQELFKLFAALKECNPFVLRERTFKNIESLTGRPLITYVAKTSNVPPGVPVAIDDSDLLGFGDLVSSIQGDSVDVFLVSNGGSVEAAERIVRLLRERFSEIRFIVPANAYSAATLICLSGDEIIMDAVGTLGPVDPQINGIPARAIIRAFEQLEERLKSEGPRALTAYMPLITKYDLHILEICKSAQDLSEELARTWLSAYMLKCPDTSEAIDRVVNFLSDYDIHKSHGRSVGLTKARELGLKVKSVTEVDGLAPLIRSLFNQYAFWFDNTSFYKMYENAHGVNWGRQIQVTVPPSPGAVPQVQPPGPPVRSN